MIVQGKVESAASGTPKSTAHSPMGTVHDGSRRRPLQDRLAIVTGAGRGIGRAIAVKLAGAGAAVAVVDISTNGARRTYESIADAGGRAAVFRADVTSPGDVDGMIGAVRASLGPVDVLVNNVGGTRSVGPVAETDPDAWWSDVGLNLRSAYLCQPGRPTRDDRASQGAHH